MKQPASNVEKLSPRGFPAGLSNKEANNDKHGWRVSTALFIISEYFHHIAAMESETENVVAEHSTEL